MTCPKLLISAQNLAEAKTAVQANVDILDLKAPQNGALGQLPQQTLQQILDANILKHIPLSTANGELADNNPKQPCDAIRYFKIGLAHCVSTPNWQKKLYAWHQGQMQKAVAVSYADHHRCSAPTPEQILDWAITHQAAGFLIDTAIKDGKNLWHWLPPQHLAPLITRAQQAGLFVALAGSLKPEDIPICLSLSADILGFRGSACKQQLRQNHLCPQKINQIQTRLASQCAPNP